jgi:hypothetical protein
MATRYWIGTTSTSFGNTNNWSDTSGGAVGFSVPGSADDAIFDGNGNNPCVLDTSRNLLTLTFQSGFTNSFDFQGFVIEIFGATGNVVTLSANMTILGTIGTSYIRLTNGASPGTRTIVSNGKALGNVSLEMRCGNTVVINGQWVVHHFWVSQGNTTINASGGGFIEVGGNFTGPTGSTTVSFNLLVNMFGTGTITLTGFSVFQNLKIESTGSVTLQYVNFYGLITHVQGLVSATQIDCGIFTPPGGSPTTFTLTGFNTNVPVNVVQVIANRTLILGSDLNVNVFTTFSTGVPTIQGAFRVLIQQSLQINSLSSSDQITTSTGSIFSIVGSGAFIQFLNQASCNVPLEINTPGNVSFALPNAVVLSSAPTNFNFQIGSNFTVLRGNVVIPPLLCFRFSGSGSSVFRGLDKVRFGFVTMANNTTYTFDEFFCGTPENPVVINGAFTIAFTNQGEKYARFVRMSGATVVAVSHLIITARTRAAIGSDNNGVHFSNVEPNTFKRNSNFLASSLDGVEPLRRVRMLVADPTKV